MKRPFMDLHVLAHVLGPPQAEFSSFLLTKVVLSRFDVLNQDTSSSICCCADESLTEPGGKGIKNDANLCNHYPNRIDSGAGHLLTPSSLYFKDVLILNEQ